MMISVQRPARPQVAEYPFGSAFIDWGIGESPDDAETAQRTEVYHAMYHKLATRLRNLVERIRGNRDT